MISLNLNIKYYYRDVMEKVLSMCGPPEMVVSVTTTVDVMVMSPPPTPSLSEASLTEARRPTLMRSARPP